MVYVQQLERVEESKEERKKESERKSPEPGSCQDEACLLDSTCP